jgi:ribosome maturation factor RimP
MEWAKAHFFVVVLWGSKRSGARMKDEGLIKRITELTEEAAAGSNVEIVEVDLRGSGKARLLRVYIDKPGGVKHGDCEYISERLSALLDESDAVPGEEGYTLEVSSPGVERDLHKPRDFERALGRKIRVSLREPAETRRPVEGKLAAFTGDTLEVETAPGKLTQIPLKTVQKARLKFEW